MIVRAVKQHGLGELDPAPDYDDGRLTIQPRRYFALADGEVIPFTIRELALLAALCRHEGKVRSREELVEAVWGGETEVSPRSVDAIVCRVRSKLGDALPGFSYIHSCHGRGYDFGQRSASEGKARLGSARQR